MAENNEKTVEETVETENQAEAAETDTVAEEKATVEAWVKGILAKLA